VLAVPWHILAHLGAAVLLCLDLGTGLALSFGLLRFDLVLTCWKHHLKISFNHHFLLKILKLRKHDGYDML